MTINVTKTPIFLRLYAYCPLKSHSICYMKLAIKTLLAKREIPRNHPQHIIIDNTPKASSTLLTPLMSRLRLPDSSRKRHS